MECMNILLPKMADLKKKKNMYEHEKKWDPGNGKERIRNKPCSTRSIKKSKKINRRWMNFKKIISI